MKANPLPGQKPIRLERIQCILSVKDINLSRSFYRDILGFQEDDWGDDEFTSMSRDGVSLYLCQGEQGKSGTWVWIGFDGDIFAWHEHLAHQGVKIRQAPINFSWALEMQIEDPDGHVLRLGTSPNDQLPFEDQKMQAD